MLQPMLTYTQVHVIRSCTRVQRRLLDRGLTENVPCGAALGTAHGRHHNPSWEQHQGRRHYERTDQGYSVN